MAEAEAHYLYEEAEAHKRVGELLRKQRELAAKCALTQVSDVNERLLEAIAEAHAATERRRRAFQKSGVKLTSPGLTAAWTYWRDALRSLKSEAELSQEVAAEMAADVKFLLGLLWPMLERYGRDGRVQGAGPVLIDSAA